MVPEANDAAKSPRIESRIGSKDTQDGDESKTVLAQRFKKIRGRLAPFKQPQNDMFHVYDMCKQTELFGEVKQCAMLESNHQARRAWYRKSKRFAGKLAAVDAHLLERAQRGLFVDDFEEPTSKQSSKPLSLYQKRKLAMSSCGSTTELPTEDSKDNISVITPSEYFAKIEQNPELRHTVTVPGSALLRDVADCWRPFTAGSEMPRCNTAGSENPAGNVERRNSVASSAGGASALASRRNSFSAEFGGSSSSSASPNARAGLLQEEPEVTEEITPLEQARRKKNVEVLKECKFFRDLQSLDPTVFEGLGAVAMECKRRRNHCVFRQGDEPDSCYVIISGSVGVYIKNMKDPDQVARERWIGNWITTLFEGALFGELALLKSTVRAASIKCVEPCVFLEIKKADFNKAIKADMLTESFDRMQFFTKNVPGCKNMNPEPAVHPSYFWQKQTFEEGHCFFKEGTMNPGVMWLLYKGELQVTRHRYNTKTKNKEFETLLPGAVFSTMSAVNYEQAEPYTVRVSSPTCEVLTFSRKDWDQIQVPVLKAIQKHLRDTTGKRLKHLCVKSSLGRDEMPSPRAAEFTDFRDAPVTAPALSIRSAASLRPLTQPRVSMAWQKSDKSEKPNKGLSKSTSAPAAMRPTTK